MLHADLAAALILTHHIFVQLLIEIVFRQGFRKISPAEFQKLKQGKYYKRFIAAWENEGNNAAVLVSCLAYLSLKGLPSPWCSTLAFSGQVSYFWLRAIFGDAGDGGFHPPIYIPGSLMRFFALVAIAHTMYFGSPQITLKPIYISDIGQQMSYCTCNFWTWLAGTYHEPPPELLNELPDSE